MYALFAILVQGQILGWSERCEDWAALVEALVAVEPVHRLGTANQWIRMRPDQRSTILLAYNYVSANALTQQNGYTLAYRECST